MGRGLSKLQKTMLSMARQNRLAEGLGPIVYSVVTPDREDLEWHSEAWREWAAALLQAGYTDTSERARRFYRDHHPEMPFYGIITIHGGRALVEAAHSETHYPAEAEDMAARGRALGLEARVRVESIRVADLYPWEVLARVYGFDGHPKTLMNGCVPLENRLREHHGEKRFDRTAIGFKRYDAARIATAKGFARLEERGLAMIFRFGNSPAIKLTTEGMREAERLSATSDGNTITGSQYDPGPMPHNSEADWDKMEGNGRLFQELVAAIHPNES